MYTRMYAFYGGLFGLCFPIVGTVIQAASYPETFGLSAGGMARAVRDSPLLWIIFTAPLFLAAFASLAGRRQDQLMTGETVRRDGFLRTASELFTAAQSLLSTVSSFSSMTAETAASVRETTATMEQLGHTATQAALTAETVIGLARQGERASVEGLSAVESSQGGMLKLADEVRGLSQRIDALNGRMRDVFGIASVVSQIADRSERLAEAAAAESRGAAPFDGIARELRGHAEDAKHAAAEVKGVLAEVHKAMLAAMTAAEVGLHRAEQAAGSAAATGDTIRRLATALRDSSQAAKEIATVAQQQDHGIEQVLRAMNEIYLASQETMSSTHAVATEAKALNDLASALKRAVET
jgi:methyl-accepting chemotaxis protein